MTTLQSKICVGNIQYSVAELLKNMESAFAFDKNEAMRWGFCIQRAFIIFGYNRQIDDAMNEILAFHDIPLIVAIEEDISDKEMDMPPLLINKIFKNDFNQDKLKNIWRWIKKYFIDEISHPYQYLSLLLFMENYHDLFLQKAHINNSDMQSQMQAWYSFADIKCSADSLGTYRNGYFCNFNYINWLNTNGEPPISYEYKKDQSLSGFQKLNKLCNNLEINLSELNI